MHIGDRQMLLEKYTNLIKLNIINDIFFFIIQSYYK